MADEKAADLALRCNQLLKAGNDFPIIWDTVLKGHALLAGVPHQQMVGTKALLDIWLVTGQRLLFDGDAKELRLE